MSLLENDLFPPNFDYKLYMQTHDFNNLFDLETNTLIATNKISTNPTASVDPSNRIPIPPDLEDLARLHHLVSSRKVISVLEFGVGKSTLAFASSLYHNKKRDLQFVSQHLRRKNLYQVHSVDNYKHYISLVSRNLPDLYVREGICHFHHSNVVMSTFSDRFCTFYDNIPPICPDLIYLDGPDQFSPKGHVRGFATSHQDRMPMAADILCFEHFLQPSTLIVIDGRSANARFLQTNLQRNWQYYYNPYCDQHFFELQEQPLGLHNQNMIDFCLGQAYYDRISR